MHEVFENPPQVAHWQAVARGDAVDWDAVFAGYRSQVDWPGAAVWSALAEAYPEAKVVHTVRPDDRCRLGRLPEAGQAAVPTGQLTPVPPSPQ